MVDTALDVVHEFRMLEMVASFAGIAAPVRTVQLAIPWL